MRGEESQRASEKEEGTSDTHIRGTDDVCEM